MKLRQRAARVVWVEGHGLLVTDVRGGIHLLDEDFQLIRSGRHPENTAPIYAATTSGAFAYTKDTRGSLTQWELATLRPVNTLDADNLRGGGEYLEGEEPSTVINRGICVWRNRVYVNNGYLELVVLDADTFDLVEVRRSFTDNFIEWFCTDRHGEQAVADKKGNLFVGDLANLDFPVQVRIDDETNLHRVKYDARHDRYWVTQDAGTDDGLYVSNGLVVISPDGRELHNFKFAADDVEVLEFNEDFTRAFSGGFDGEIVVFDNRGAEPSIVTTIRPFRHQIIDLTVTKRGDLVVLGQDGQMERIGPDGERKARLDFDSSCVWDIQPDRLTEQGYLVSTDTGVLEIRLVDTDRSHPNVRVTARWDLGLGFIRRVRPVPDGTFLGISRSGVLFRADRTGTLAWSADFEPHLHDLSLNSDSSRVLVAANEGAVEHDAATGERVRRLDVGPLIPWTCSYGPGNELVVGTRNGVLFCFESTGEPRWRLDFDGYVKRIRPDGELMLATGGGFGAALIDYADGKVHGQWLEGLENTVENAVIIGDRVYLSSYGLQLGVYGRSSPDLLGMIEPAQDFPKAMARHCGAGKDLLLLGGRGGFLEIRGSGEEGPRLLRTVYLPAGY